MEDNGEKSPCLPSKVSLRSVVHYVIESVIVIGTRPGVPLTFVDSCIKNRENVNFYGSQSAVKNVYVMMPIVLLRRMAAYGGIRLGRAPFLLGLALARPPALLDVDGVLGVVVITG